MMKITGRERSILIMNSEKVPDGWRRVYEWTNDRTGKINGATLEKIVDGVARRGDVWIPLSEIRNTGY
jgi:hypothetical protein